MKTYSTSEEFNITGISISHILFDQTDHVNLMGKCRVDNIIQPIHLLISFGKFNDLLRFTGEMGENIHLLMVDALLGSQKPPYIIDVAAHFNKEFVVTSCKLTCKLINESFGEAKESYFIVNDLMPLNIIQQAKNLKQNTFDFGTISLIESKVLNYATQQLAEMYRYYCGLLELDINENAAKAKANLTDTFIFNMAKQAYMSKL